MCAYLQTAAGYAKVCPRIAPRAARGMAGRRAPRRSTPRTSRRRPRLRLLPPSRRSREPCPPLTPGPVSATRTTALRPIMTTRHTRRQATTTIMTPLTTRDPTGAITTSTLTPGLVTFQLGHRVMITHRDLGNAPVPLVVRGHMNAVAGPTREVCPLMIKESEHFPVKETAAMRVVEEASRGAGL